MLLKNVPQFGVYDEREYKLAAIVANDRNQMITYQLPDTNDGRYNIVLHGLLDLKVDEKKTCRVRITTDFDAICLGLHVAEEMVLE